MKYQCYASTIVLVFLPSVVFANQHLRLALISDAHIIGPQYRCCHESNDVDNDSIIKSADRLRSAVQSVNSLSPQPDAVVFVGDILHDGYVDKDGRTQSDYSWYVDPVNLPNAYTIGSEILTQLRAPTQYLWGNHDYKTDCASPDNSVPRNVTARLIDHFFKGAAPYSSTKLGAWRLILLNGMLGETWDPASSWCHTPWSSFGPQQLQWLHTQLAAGEPTLVFVHHPLSVAVRGEAPGMLWPDLITVLMRHQHVVRGVFTGHYHRGLDWGSAYPFPVRTLPSTRFDPDNFFLLELQSDGSSFKVLDWAKNKGGSRCSETWDYSGPVPKPSLNPGPETGSCGDPSFNATSSYVLPDVMEVDSIPGPSGHQFNPEKSCSTEFMPQVLATCLAGPPSPKCCDILAYNTRPSSVAWAASCWCQRRFYAKGHALFKHHGRDLHEVLHTCHFTFQKDIQYPGRPAGSCLTWDGGIPGAGGQSIWMAKQHHRHGRAADRRQ
mmetsp:Transcript_34780/g.77337  ORF Transcript_34780/g.77337 Transcript_34780/m.77337 type:complete len:494 (+) Transcript_34780:69-1550(+)